MNCLKNTIEMINECNKIHKIYIPLEYLNGENIVSFIKKGNYVLKGSIIGRTKNNGIPIFSSISGKVIGIELKTILNNKKVNCIVIENDYKEKNENGINKLDYVDKNVFLTILKDLGIIELDNTYLPVYKKYITNKKIKKLVIDSTANNHIIKKHCEEILEIIDIIIEINDINEAIIVINKKNKDLLKLINNYIGTYLKIKVEIISKDFNYNNMKDNTIVNNISTIYAIYQAVKLNKPIIEKYITISYNNNSYNILVKLGTSIKEIFDYLGIEYKNKNIFINNKMIFKSLEDLIITSELNNIKITSYDKM